MGGAEVSYTYALSNGIKFRLNVHTPPNASVPLRCINQDDSRTYCAVSVSSLSEHRVRKVPARMEESSYIPGYLTMKFYYSDRAYLHFFLILT